MKHKGAESFRPLSSCQLYRFSARAWVGLPADALCARALGTTSRPAAGLSSSAGRAAPGKAGAGVGVPRHRSPRSLRPGACGSACPPVAQRARPALRCLPRSLSLNPGVFAYRGEAYIAGRAGSGASPGAGTLPAGGGTWAGVGSMSFRATPLPSQCSLRKAVRRPRGPRMLKKTKSRVCILMLWIFKNSYQESVELFKSNSKLLFQK